MTCPESPLGAELFGLAHRVHDRLRATRSGPPSVVVIDGRSGSGKTSLAAGLARLLGAAILPVEDLYPGWGGLAAGSAALAPALDARAYARYDWHAAAFAEQVTLDRPRRLVIEGCGALSAETLAAAARWAGGGGAGAVHAVWVDCPAEERRERALTRDGDLFRPHWESWAAQEDALFARTRPLALAREVVHAGSR
ncbi:AAA family ATPase [Leucobacter tardus]|uniref:hypothetical protein n=1 Tax=Leucobacter tardus TaxID=501483 RepID=UPI001FBA6430|nr:hypothetical protein [Leucobacter tardus]